MQENSDVSFEDVFPSNLQSLIQPKYSLLKELNESKAVSVICKLAKQIPFYEKKINDLEFILMICQYIENLKIVSQHKNKKVDKHAMLQTIFHILFNIDPNSEEMQKVQDSVQFLINHKKVYRYSFFKRLFLSVVNLVL